VDGDLHVEVSDGGRSEMPWSPGVGLRSMTERAQELGGSIEFDDGVVRASLPLHLTASRGTP
jgi:signal transduction histidine kinase